MKSDSLLTKQAWGMIFGLSVQFILGMVANLYATFPKSGTQDQYWQAAWKNGFVGAHIVLGTIIFLNTIFLVFRATKAKSSVWLAPTWIGLVGVVIASSAGSQFVATQVVVYSLLMSVGFIIAFLSYAWGLFRSKA